MPESSPESSAKSLAHSFFVVPFLSPMDSLWTLYDDFQSRGGGSATATSHTGREKVSCREIVLQKLTVERPSASLALCSQNTETLQVGG